MPLVVDKKVPKPCPSCMKARAIGMRVEAVQPLPEGALAPLGLDNKPQCKDCASAGTLMRMLDLTWTQARIAVANDRQELTRLPGVEIGLAKDHIMSANEEGDLERHLEWLERVGLSDADH